MSIVWFPEHNNIVNEDSEAKRLSMKELVTYKGKNTTIFSDWGWKMNKNKVI